MRKYLFTLLLGCGVLASSCADQELLEKKSVAGTGSVRFTMSMPAVGGVTRGALDSPENVVDYASDFQVDRINIYVFDDGGQLQKIYTDVENHLSKDSPTTDITLENVPSGNNRTLLCVVNPDSFGELQSLPEDVTLEQVLRYTSKPVGSTEPDAVMFMISKNVVNVQSGATTNITGALTRGVARLDVFSIDTQIVVDSVRVLGTASRSYMMSQGSGVEERVSLTKELDSFEGRSKITYLNELSAPVNLEIYLTRDGAQGVANLQVPAVTRNNIYSVNLEVVKGTHLVMGTLSITPWTNNVLDGSVASDVLFDSEATISSFRMNDGGSVSMENDTTLLLPGGTGAGLLCFRDGAEVSASLVNAGDTAMFSINRNAATRGSIKTSFDISVKALETTALDSLREAKIRVTNLMTGKGRVFVVRQQSAGYKRIGTPVLDFSNSHQSVKDLLLEGVSSVNELTMPTDRDFTVTTTRQPSGEYRITVNRKRIYDIVPTGKQLVITRAGKKAVIIELAADRGFVYKEVQMGDVVFMDRDLGASGVDHTGEIFIPGSLMPLNQAGFASGVANGFVGQGRVSGASVSHNYTTKWFIKADGGKNEEIDPCPEGWHVATFSEYEQILTSVVGVTSNPILNQGVLKTSVGLDASKEEVSVSMSGKTVTFNYSGGHFYKTGLAYYKDWPCGWWTSSKADNGHFKHLAFGVNSPYEIGLRVHSISDSKTGLNIRCVKDNAGEGTRSSYMPTVRLGGKEWMSFNSMGKGNSVQMLCNLWDNVEDMYKGQWTERLGMLFQWGRKYAHNQWTTYANNPGSETSSYNDWNSKPEQLPCPDGFRIPTKEELSALLPSIQLPAQATYQYGDERVRASLHSAIPSQVTDWHGFSGEARYLKITSLESGNYLIFPLSGAKGDKVSGTDPGLGQRFRLWKAEYSATGEAGSGGRIADLKYEPLARTVAIPSFDSSRPKEAYSYVRCLKQ